MSLHPSIANALEEIDAMMFSGDTMMHEPGRSEVLEYFARWQRKVAEQTCYYAADGMLMNMDGTRSIFDDIDE